MHKFKVGDKVRVVARHNGHEFNIGDIVTITNCNRKDNDYECIDDTDYWFLTESEIEPVKPRQLELGGTYTDKTGVTRMCVYVNDTHAWLAHPDFPAPAYVWSLDGASVSLNSSYDIIFPPVIEVKRESVTVAGETLTIRYEVIDGVSDFINATIEPL